MSGVATTVFVVTWLLAVRRNAYMMIDVFLTLGTLVPLLASHFLFGEEISVRQLIGFSFLIAAAIMCSYNTNIKGKISVGSIVLLLVSGFAGGLTDFSQKLYVKVCPELPVSVFNLYTYVFATITLAICVAVMPKQKGSAPKADIVKIRCIYVSIMAFALTANTYFKTVAAEYLDSVRLYPLNQAVSITLSVLMSSLLFKEKFTLTAFVGILLAFISVMIINC